METSQMAKCANKMMIAKARSALSKSAALVFIRIFQYIRLRDRMEISVTQQKIALPVFAIMMCAMEISDINRNAYRMTTATVWFVSRTPAMLK